jgi:tetratricopeptide (TPR) repeat protein
MNDHVVKWLEEQASPSWLPTERGCLHILTAFRLHDDEKHAQAVAAFERAFQIFGKELPQKEKAWRCFLNSVYELGQGERALAERACRWAVDLGLVETVRWNHDYYWVLHNAGRYAEAGEYCGRVVKDDPHQLQAYCFLGHIFAVHLDRIDEAEKVYCDGICIDETNNSLHFFLADLLADSKRYDESEKEYRKALELTWEQDDKITLLRALANLLSQLPARTEEARTLWHELLELDPENAETLNSLAWSLYSGNADLEKAKECAKRASELKPQAVHILQTFAAILVRLDNWMEAKSAVRNWLIRSGSDRVREMWHEDVLLFIDAARNGHCAELSSLLPQDEGNAIWKVISSALQAYGGQLQRINSLEPKCKRAAEQVLEQLRSANVGNFPSLG